MPRAPLIILILLIVLQIVFPLNPIGALFGKAFSLPARVAFNNSTGPVTTAKDQAASQQEIDIPGCNKISASVFRRNVNSYERLVQIDKGELQGVREGMLVVSGQVFVGYISKVGSDNSWITLASDPDFRLAVLIDGVAGQSILKGASTAIVVDRVPESGPLGGRTIRTAGTSDNQVAGLVVGDIDAELNESEGKVLSSYTVNTLGREEFVAQVSVCQPIGGAE